MSLLLTTILLLQSEIPLVFGGDQPAVSAIKQFILVCGWSFSIIGVGLLVTGLILRLLRLPAAGCLVAGILSVGMGRFILLRPYLPIQDVHTVFAALSL